MTNPLARFFGIGMQIGSPLSERIELLRAQFDHLNAIDPDALPVTRKDAMSVAAVARGRAVIASTIARLPLVVMRGAHPLETVRDLIEKPENGRPRYQTLVWTVDAMLFYGRAWWHIVERGQDGRARRVVWLPEWEIETDQKGEICRAYGKPVNPADVIRIDAPHEGILNYAAPRIRAAIRLDRAALLASDNPVPAVELHQVKGEDLSPDAAREFVAAYAAARKTHGVSYTNQSIETRTHGATPEQLLISGRDASALDIARVLNLPAWAVDAPTHGNSMNYSNVPSRARELLDYTLAPYMEAICARLSEDDVLPRGMWCRFDPDALTADDFAARMNAYKTALDTGIYTLDELRAREMGAPLERTPAND